MLADVYTAGGEVLMGTLRWEKEDEEKAGVTEAARRVRSQARASSQVAEADTHARITALQLDLERQRVELAQLSKENDAHLSSTSEREQELRPDP